VAEAKPAQEAQIKHAPMRRVAKLLIEQAKKYMELRLLRVKIAGRIVNIGVPMRRRLLLFLIAPEVS
jgi:hypothetical protein